jgi:hypothetical protein
VRVSDRLDVDELVTSRAAAAVVEAGLAHVLELFWPTETPWPTSLDTVACATARGRSYREGFLDLGPELGEACLGFVRLGYGVLRGWVAAGDPAVLSRAETWLRGLVPPAQPTEAQRVPITFWSHGPRSARTASRTIEVPTWQQIAGNYPDAVGCDLARLLDTSFRPGIAGQLVLWYGPPGTGKTTALRALAWEWREWCSLHYVTDPEEFFGRSSYMLDVLLHNDDPADEEDGERVDGWRLLVLEDTGELLAADAKDRTGQGLSRLLNVVDGIIGQGLRVLVLVTTNEELTALHPAVVRPGRCAAQIEFPRFSAEEAERWLAERGLPAEQRQATLAELFGGHSGIRPAPRPRVGF